MKILNVEINLVKAVVFYLSNILKKYLILIKKNYIYRLNNSSLLFVQYFFIAK